MPVKAGKNLQKFQNSKFSLNQVKPRKVKSAIEEEKQRIRANKIKRIQEANPFATNVGLKHQLRGTGLPDPDDPAFYDRDFESDVNIADKLEQIRSKSKIDQRRTERGISKEELFNREEVRLAIVKKKYFPDPPESPNLLTWMEGEMMRKLYQDDPQTWTFERLSECFPVTAKGAKKIV